MPLFSPTAANVAQTAHETVVLARSCLHPRWETLAAVLGAVIIAVATAMLQPLSCRQPARPSPSRARSPGCVERAHRMRTPQHTALMALAVGQLPRLRAAAVRAAGLP